MRIEINNDSVCLGNGHVIKMEDFPGLYREFCDAEKKAGTISTADTEKAGVDILKDGLDNVECANIFVRKVFEWGGITGKKVGGNLYKHQTEKTVAKVVAESARILQNGDLESAIKKITSIKYLGISYGSKILRMLSPQQAGVYDSILYKNFSYRETDGYVEFCDDCKTVADELKKLGIKSHRENREWFVADVEAVIFHFFYDPKKTKGDVPCV